MMTLTVRPAGIVTPEAALALYDLALTSGAASAYEAAAHALAKALQRQQALSVAMSRPASASPLGAPCEPPKAKPARKASARAAKAAEDDLTALFSTPRNKAVTGSYWVVWEDGSATRVCGVVHHAGKPQTRWAAALRAADNLRRLRGRREHIAALEHMAADAVPGLHAASSAEIMIESADFQRLTAIRPMPALAAIYDETSGDMFTPPLGRRYAAGDAVEATALEARLVQPRLFWRKAEVAAQGFMIYRGRLGGHTITYEVGGKMKLHTADMDAATLKAMRASATDAFSPPAAPFIPDAATIGGPAPESPFELDGLAVVIDPAAARTESDAEFARSWGTLPDGRPIRYAFKRLPGSHEFRLTPTRGFSVIASRERIKLLRLAA